MLQVKFDTTLDFVSANANYRTSSVVTRTLAANPNLDALWMHPPSILLYLQRDVVLSYTVPNSPMLSRTLL